ncbi:Phytanoyl-CoA dioxygenase (PhyH) [Nocardia amikacinitolerans]|uniref:Phytanoyl-CoA dioxygenase (PhyH) n=1 Tax=Nocardia amikacinitolerans TaxID=756689 RepID=A0A285LTZ5_9NOCA|nr:phytanoyl-CoA dioxygenase family protein [Nocardia amikacinitolerans]MCP2274471.1 Phytanoyl-CoA dioxygenase (PhyH) [Nocardia amikacinitolerans]SNY88382.1 Phytanoyl-CoA dioxygenase (PhyH) [Nocardia amikacinitolerans]
MNATPAPGLRRVPSTAPINDILTVVNEDGGVILEGLLTADQVARFNTDIDADLAQLAPGSTHADEIAKEFHGANTKRLTNVISRSKVYREEIIDHDLVHSLCDAVFLEESGTYWMTTSQVIEIGPGNKAQMLHRDLENWFPFVGMGPAGPEVIVNFLIALTDFTEENGATRVIPGSNHWPDFEDRGTPEQTVAAEMKAGDALFFSGKTVHGGGANQTSSEYRRALGFALNPGFLVGEEAYPFLVDRDLAATLSPRVQQLIGFRSQYPKGSPGLWMVDYLELADYLASH